MPKLLVQKCQECDYYRRHSQAKHTPPEEMPHPATFCFAPLGTATQAHVHVRHYRQNYWKECHNRGKSRKRTKGRGKGDVETWPCFLSNILFRQWDKGRECDGMKMWKEVLDCISQISAGFTHWQRPSFPFPPIISTSSYVVLGKGGGAFLSTLSDDVIHSSAANKKPPPPRTPTPSPTIQDPSPCIPEVRHVFWFFWQRKLKSRVSALHARLWVILLYCSLNKQQPSHICLSSGRGGQTSCTFVSPCQFCLRLLAVHPWTSAVSYIYT